MATDIELTPDRKTRYDGRGDFATVSDEQWRQQRAITQALDVGFDWEGGVVTPERAEEARADIARAIRNDDAVDVPVDATITDVEGTTVTIRVVVGNETYTVEAP